MSLEAAITENTAAIRELIAALANGAAVPAAGAAGEAAAAPKGRGRPPKAKEEPAAAAASESKEEQAELDPFADDTAPPAAQKTYAVEDVRKALIDLSKKNKDKATAILKSCKKADGAECASIGEIAPADYARVVTEATAALG